MSASPSPRSPGGEPTPRAGTLVEWLRSRTDRELAGLLKLRADLALPAPADIASLAGRLVVRTSTQRAVDGLDAPALRALENLVLAAGDEDTVENAEPTGLAELFDRALVWGAPDLVQLTPTVREAVGPYPAGLGRPAALLLRQARSDQLAPVLRSLALPPAVQPRASSAVAERYADPRWVTAQIAGTDDDERELLDRLAAGPPVGTIGVTGSAATGSRPPAPHRLVNRGLLIPIDSRRVELPRELGIALRGDMGGGSALEPPMLRVVQRAPDELDRLGTTTALESLRLVDAVADAWSANPPAVLRAGGLGVRDLRRTVKELSIDEPVAALIVETMYAAGLLNATHGMEPVFLPTGEYDQWRRRPTPHRWTALASAWLAMTRQPSLIGRRGDRDRVITALGPDAERGTLPAFRRQVLAILAGLAPGAAPTERADVLAVLAWRQPRRSSGQAQLAESILAETDALGLTAAGGLTGYTRTLLAGSASAAQAALDHALPDPVDHFLVQPDLTVVVPGPPEPSLGAELGLVADLESTGGASVYRITERSVRQALDAGRSSAELAAFITTRSRTPIPQALTYLIEDASRRHGVLRAGTAGSYLRCEDESLLARVVADRGTSALGLRLLAPTVAVADAPSTQVLDVLREAGFAPAAESAAGEIVTLGAEPPRAPARPASRAAVVRGATDTDAQLGELVRRMRSGDALTGTDRRVQAIAAQIPGVTSARTMEVLRDAIRGGRLIWFGCAEADGRTTAHTLQPISLAAGTVRGWEDGVAGLASYPVHRITSIRVLDDDEED